jgi:hypothetical protein
VVWGTVLKHIQTFCCKWEIHEGKVRVGDRKHDTSFGKELGEVWLEWEEKVNEWWAEVCGEQKEAGGWLKVGSSKIQDMVKSKKAPEWESWTGWEWIERRMVEALASKGKGGQGVGGKGWARGVSKQIEGLKGEGGMNKGLCSSIQESLEEMITEPTLVAHRYMEHLLGRVREERKKSWPRHWEKAR